LLVTGINTDPQAQGFADTIGIHTLFWLGSDDLGYLSVYRADGLTPIRPRTGFREPFSIANCGASVNGSGVATGPLDRDVSLVDCPGEFVTGGLIISAAQHPENFRLPH
jgi:hypothetical protein